MATTSISVDAEPIWDRLHAPSDKSKESNISVEVQCKLLINGSARPMLNARFAAALNNINHNPTPDVNPGREEKDMDSATKDEEQAPAKPGPVKAPVNIRYVAVCEYRDGADFTLLQDNEPFNLEVTQVANGLEPEQDAPNPILEIMTGLLVATKEPRSKYSNSSKVSLDGKRILKIYFEKMIIYSPLLLSAIRKIVEYYPR